MLNTKFYNISLLILLIAAHTAVFWFSDIDMQVANFFYHPEEENPWPLGDMAIWKFFYQLAEIITIALVLSTLLIILFSFIKPAWKRYRIQALFILLCFVIGPGLIVNSVFKEHWGRPRAVSIEPFGGQEHYIPPLKYNADGEGHSFPSGHSSLGFAFIAFWFLWCKKRRLWANYALLFSINLGVLFGVSRMVAGGHFLSDIFWSLWIPLLVSMALYHFFFKKYLN